ncbi:MAG: hypothetical protein OQL08_06010 [Gammaproteobacteria bacterium]|nr:hypothetical protein [Gammaproteobacteria bacterium]
MSKRILVITLSLALALLAGCRSEAVYNVEQAAVVASIDKPSAQDVKTAIMRAGGGLGWVMKENGNGKLIGTLSLRKHLAVVDIDYSTKSYSINYKDSQQLDYTGTTIHKNYNGWIQNLNRAIQTQLNLL